MAKATARDGNIPKLKPGAAGTPIAASTEGVLFAERSTLESQRNQNQRLVQESSKDGATESLQIRDRIKEFRRVPANNLIRNPRNWRLHPESQAAVLRGLLAEIGYAAALLVRELPNGRLMIIDGHLRADTTPNAVVPVLVLDVNEEEANKILLTHDPLAAMAESDSERVKALLQTVRTDHPAVEELLKQTAGNRLWEILHPQEIQEAEVAPDRADELRAKWDTSLGQCWQINSHRIICGDSSDEAVFARAWDNSAVRFRMICTDPPYGVNYAAKNAYLNRSDRGNRIQRPISNDQPANANVVFRKALELARSRAFEGAACYATVPSGPLLSAFIDAMNQSGFTFRQSLVWVKPRFVLGMSDYHHRHELILYGWLANGAHYFIDDRTKDSVFEVDRPSVSDLHPTTKPVELIAGMIANSSRVGEAVYDPFCGSGSTIVAAHQLGRIGYGCELDPGYVAVALERLSLLGLKPELVDN